MLAQFFKRKQSPDNQPGIAGYAKDFFMHSYVHFCALADLFAIEAAEYAQILKRRAILAAIALFTLALAYLSLWAMLMVYLWLNWCSYGALSVFAGFHSLMAIIFIVLAWRTKPGSFAPMTQDELKTDLTCIKLSLKENDEH